MGIFDPIINVLKGETKSDSVRNVENARTVVSLFDSLNPGRPTTQLDFAQRVTESQFDDLPGGGFGDVFSAGAEQAGGGFSTAFPNTAGAIDDAAANTDIDIDFPNVRPLLGGLGIFLLILVFINAFAGGVAEGITS